MQEYMICTDGKKRKAIRITCKECKKECLVRKRNKVTEFCSLSCSAQFKKTNNNVLVNCANCKKQFSKKKSSLQNSKSGLFFCNRKCKDEAQKTGGIKEIMPPHYGTSSEGIYGYRAKAIESGIQLICTRCGYNEFESSVDIHHIDEDKNNNDIENFMALCANCHRGLHCGRWNLNDVRGV